MSKKPKKSDYYDLLKGMMRTHDIVGACSYAHHPALLRRFAKTKTRYLVFHAAAGEEGTAWLSKPMLAKLKLDVDASASVIAAAALPPGQIRTLVPASDWRAVGESLIQACPKPKATHGKEEDQDAGRGAARPDRARLNAEPAS